MATALAPLHRQRAAPRRNVATIPHVSVVIVNYCQWRNTAQLAKQLRHSYAARDGSAEIVVVDNHSPSDPLLGRLRRTDGISVRRFNRNRGFARAVNEGCRLSRGAWFLLLNPDMSAAPGFLDEVESLAQQLIHEDPKAGVIGLSVRDTDGSPQPSCGPLPTLFNTLAGLLRPRSLRRCQALAANNRVPVEWATGCALLVRRDCFEEIGGFDADFFLYYEDVDLCLRAKEHGWNVLFEPNLPITHHTPLHGRSVPAQLRLITRHALLTYARKHWPRWQTLLLGGTIGLESLVRQTAAWWKRRPHDVFFHSQIRKLVADVLRGRDAQIRSRIRQAASALTKIFNHETHETHES